MKKENEEKSSSRRYARRGHFDPALRAELIKEIESGTPRSVIVYQYGVSRAAISKWMRDHSSKEYQTLNKWLKASVKEKAELAADDRFEMKGTSTEQPGLPDPEKEALKKALEAAQLKISALNTLIDVAEDQFKIRIRKKAGARQS
jgi:transposase